MTDLLDLYGLAEEHGTEVYWFDLGTAESLSLPLEDGSCAIAMDPWRDVPLWPMRRSSWPTSWATARPGAFITCYAAPGCPPEI